MRNIIAVKSTPAIPLRVKFILTAGPAGADSPTRLLFRFAASDLSMAGPQESNHGREVMKASRAAQLTATYALAEQAYGLGKGVLGCVMDPPSMQGP